MVAWSESEKADIRAYLGFPALFHQFEPRLENAIRSVQSVADGGVLNDGGATQERMRDVLSQLAEVDCRLRKTQIYGQALSVDGNDIKVDYIRAGIWLRMEGRRLITQLAIPLGTTPIKDYYTGLPINNGGFGGNSPFPTDLA